MGTKSRGEVRRGEGSASNRNLHQERALVPIEAVEPRATREVHLPNLSMRVDLVVPFDRAPSDFWGPLRPRLLGRVALVEHFSSTLGQKELADCVLKYRRWQKRPPPQPESGGLSPVLVVLCEGLTHAVRARLDSSGDSSSPWLWRLRDLGEEVGWVVDQRHLPRTDGHHALGLLGRHDTAEWTARVWDLLGDSTISTRTKELIMEAEMDTRTRRHPGEAARQEDGADVRALWEQWIHQLKDLHIRDALAEGEARGIEKGRREAQAELRRAKERERELTEARERELAKGLEQGRREAEASARRQVVLALLRELVDDATYARLEYEPSVDALEAALRERVRALAR